MTLAAFDSSYYSAAAQIIPVFFLAAFVSDRWPKSKDEEPFDLHSYLLAVLLASLAGEITALWALGSERTPSRVEDWIVAGGLILPTIFVAFNVAVASVDAFAARLSPGWRRVASVVAQALIYGTIYVAVTEVFNPGLIFAALAAVFWIGPTLAALFRKRD